jgi:hypothetical protein
MDAVNNYMEMSDGEQASERSVCGGTTMMRRIAVVGDELSPGGGQLKGYAGRPAFFNGHQPALIGGDAYCEVCRSVGIIAKSGGPRRMQFMGEIALDGDIVLCRCAIPPRIHAVLAGEKWYDDLAESKGMVTSSRAVGGGVASVVQGAFDEQVRAMGRGASDGYPYYIETADGRIYSGRLGDDGLLPRIGTGASADEYSVYWGDEALAKQDSV